MKRILKYIGILSLSIACLVYAVVISNNTVVNDRFNSLKQGIDNGYRLTIDNQTQSNITDLLLADIAKNYSYTFIVNDTTNCIEVNCSKTN